MPKHSIRAVIGGSVWTHAVSIGQRVKAGTVILLCESMKTELPIETPIDGEVSWIAPCGKEIEKDDIIAIVDDGT